MRKAVLAASAVAVAALMGGIVAPAGAHHSFAMFDMKKQITLSGTVRTVEWTNPHIWLWLNVPDPATGKVAVWGLEGTAPGELLRQGWKRDSIKKGDKITATARPLRDGRTGGSLGRVTFADGRVLGRGGGAAPGGPPPGGEPQP